MFTRIFKRSAIAAAPGGRLRANESPYEALQRELKEETGLDLGQFRDLKFIMCDFRYAEDRRSSMMHFFFLGEYGGGFHRELQPDNYEVDSTDLFTLPEVIEKLKDRHAAKRMQMILDNSTIQSIYLENTNSVF